MAESPSPALKTPILPHCTCVVEVSQRLAKLQL